MLTSYQTLLGSLAAALCATGTISQNDSTDFPLAENESFYLYQMETAYRGSGRVDEQPENEDHAQSKASLIAHRGSGRIQTQCLW
ncbi:MAG: hypothetical protein AAF703_16680 [Cyanobacteria bacterium P01_D01_bin.105]